MTSSSWPKDSAGQRMTEHVPVAHLDETLQDIERRIRAGIDSWKSIHYVYVLDEERHLAGILSVSDLYRHPPSAKAGDVCKRSPIVHVKATSHQERAAYLALQHGIKAVPVTDHEHRFLGAIPADDVLRILYHEMREDELRRAGIRHAGAMGKSVMDLSVWTSFRHRFPWLLLGLLGGLLAARVIGAFEATLQKNLVLATFIPLIVYMGDAVGTQMEAYMIRDLAVDRHLAFGRYFLRQILIVVLLGCAFGMLLAGAAALLYRDWPLAVTLALALCAAILSSVCTGLVFPYVFSRLRWDPADASGPIATIVQDMLSIVLYFAIATVMLR